MRNPWAPIAACVLILAGPAQADDDITKTYEEAQEHFLAGDYATALPLFERIADDSPNARLYVARCQRELGRLAQAYETMRVTATEAAERAVKESRFESTRRAAEDELNALRARVVLLTVASVGAPPADLAITVNDVPFPTDALGTPRAFMPGSLHIRATAEGHVPFESDAEAGPGEERSVMLAMRKPEEPPKPAPVVLPDPVPTPSPETSNGLLYAGIATGALGIGAGAVFLGVGLSANAKFDDLERSCAPNCTQDQLDEGETLDLVANISAGVMGVSLVTTAVLLAVHFATGDAPTTNAWVPRADGGQLTWSF